MLQEKRTAQKYETPSKTFFEGTCLWWYFFIWWYVIFTGTLVATKIFETGLIPFVQKVFFGTSLPNAGQ